jgi:chromosomal replication initiation ATPase DnaA
MDKQMSFDFRHAPSYAAEDFLAADSNVEAYGWIVRWPNWPSFALGLWGPAGSGKSHLAQVFRWRSHGVVVSAGDLSSGDVPRLAEQPAVAVEDADRGVDETALLHLYNLSRETGCFLLLTGRQAPARWPVRLPDLLSRLVTMPVAAIGEPSDGLLESLLLKLFADRQMRVGPEILSYLLPRMERSFDRARTLVEALEAAARPENRSITIPFVRAVMSGEKP